MKFTLLGLALLISSCQTTETVSSRTLQPSVDPSTGPAVSTPAAVTPAPEAPKAKLPRWNHLDRAQFAVRDWVRDRG